MKNKSFETILYSTVGVVALFLIVLALNVIFGTAKKRIDLTEEKAYTLSPGTKAILGKLDSKVTLRFYFFAGEESSPEGVFLKTYASRIDDLLSEYKEAGKGKIVIEKYSPSPDSDAEDSARLNGIEGQMLPNGERIYLGLAVSLTPEKQTVPLPPNRERLLEYDISRAISRVVTPQKPIVGVMSALPVFGQPANPMMQRMGQQQQGQEPWVFLSELKNDFEVKRVEITAEKIDDDITVLVVLHPRDIGDAAQYAIDQFVLRGGKLIAFVDPMAYFDQQNNQFAQFGGGGGNSSLGKLMKAWGVEMETGKVAADRMMAARNPQGGVMPAVLLMTKNGISTNDVVTSELNNLVLPFPGAFTGTPADGLKQTVLLQTTTDSQMVDGLMASMSGDQISKEFKSSGKQLPVAIRLTGKFKTAFPEGKPKEKSDEEKSDEKKPEATAGNSLKESATDGAVVLVADSDILQDQVSVEVMNFLGQRILRPINDNLNFVQSLVEQLSGDSNLINLRSRASMHRPLTRINEMKAKAEEKAQDKLKEMQASLEETQKKLSELQRTKDTGQKFILSPEQQKEIENFQKKEAEVRIALKEERKKLKKETASLESWTKAINIAAMPIGVAFVGLALAVVKRKRTAAK